MADEKVIAAGEAKSKVAMKIDELYPKDGKFDAEKMRQARNFIKAVFKSDDERARGVVQICINDVVMRAVKDATEEPAGARGPETDEELRARTEKALLYFNSVRDFGTKEEKDTALLFLENVIAREVAKPVGEMDPHAIYAAYKGLEALWDPRAVGTLRDGAEKITKGSGSWGSTYESEMLKTADQLERYAKLVPEKKEDEKPAPKKEDEKQEAGETFKKFADNSDFVGDDEQDFRNK